MGAREIKSAAPSILLVPAVRTEPPRHREPEGNALVPGLHADLVRSPLSQKQTLQTEAFLLGQLGGWFRCRTHGNLWFYRVSMTLTYRFPIGLYSHITQITLTIHYTVFFYSAYLRRRDRLR
jgi:hypothetical protein